MTTTVSAEKAAVVAEVRAKFAESSAAIIAKHDSEFCGMVSVLISKALFDQS